ncbi:hypothetical protein ACTNEF_06900 [Bariatricus sp. HCP28S3_E4]|uniref:hypothetical protein n=1 Tax=unclassified Bariatricus TaxID=2677046 RepID=UPI003F8CE638
MRKYAELPWSVEDTIENITSVKDSMKERVILLNLHGRGEKDAEEVEFDFGRAIDALERQEKYRWHNLNKDPEDLPKNLSKSYLFENKLGQVFKGTFRIVGNIKLFETHIYSKVHGGDIWLQYKTCNVVRWKEIEPMEE